MTPSGQPANSFILMPQERTYRCGLCSRVWVQGQYGLEDITDVKGWAHCFCGRLFRWLN